MQEQIIAVGSNSMRLVDTDAAAAITYLHFQLLATQVAVTRIISCVFLLVPWFE